MPLTKIIKQILFVAAFSFCLILSACVCQTCPPALSPNRGKPCGDLMDSLEKQGVQVIARGDTLRLILPTDVFFDFDSTHVKPKKEATLAIIAKLATCACYGVYPIQVNGYSDDVGSITEQKRRSYEQAHDIAAYLWSNGISLSRMYVRGYGAQKTIATNETPKGSFYNRRVEILIP